MSDHLKIVDAIRELVGVVDELTLAEAEGSENGLTSFLGRCHPTLGFVTTYEWDFDGRRGGGYSQGLTLI